MGILKTITDNKHWAGPVNLLDLVRGRCRKSLLTIYSAKKLTSLLFILPVMRSSTMEYYLLTKDIESKLDRKFFQKKVILGQKLILAMGNSNNINIGRDILATWISEEH